MLPEERILFTGDSVNRHLWMQLEDCAPMEEFGKNLDRIMLLICYRPENLRAGRP